MALPEGPFLHLFIDLNDGCNLKCSMCGPRASLRDQKVLPLPFFKKRILPLFRHVADFQLGCACEPLMLPYLAEALEGIARHLPPGVQGQLITNGTLLTEGRARTLLESQAIRKVRISVDGAQAATFEEIRQGARFDKVMDNVKRLCRMRSSLGSEVLVEFNFTIQRSNHLELPKLILLASKLGVDSVTTHKLVPFDVRGVDEPFRDSVHASQAEAREMAQAMGVAFTPATYRSDGEFLAWKRAACLAERDGFRLDQEGFLFPQCHAAQKQGPVGNLLLQSFEEIWESGAYRHYRACIDLPHEAQCADCLHFG
jgi:MoaA/NifB/PqqE/SkfB family radical SAM enzyme